MNMRIMWALLAILIVIDMIALATGEQFWAGVAMGLALFLSGMTVVDSRRRKRS